MRSDYIWFAIAAVVLQSSVADVLMARAMKQVGDTGELRRRVGLLATIRRVFTNRTFFTAILFITLSFFTLLLALSWGDVSLVGPASASLTFITNALGAKLFLGERVDSRRWISAVLVGGGVALLAG